MVINYHTDPAHGWLEVRREYLYTLNIADKISKYSYQKGDKVFLEEDCDATRFVRALENHGIAYELNYISEDSMSNIRNMERYTEGN